MTGVGEASIYSVDVNFRPAFSVPAVLIALSKFDVEFISCNPDVLVVEVLQGQVSILLQ